MSTYFPKAGEIVRKWYVVDASGQTLGRLASQVARILMGKENPQLHAVSRHRRSRHRHQRREGEDDGHEVGAEGVSALHRISRADCARRNFASASTASRS